MLFLLDREISGEGHESSTEVVSDCSDVNDMGGLSLLGRSTVCSVEVNNWFDVRQSCDTIAGGKNTVVLAAVAEVATSDDTSHEASLKGQLATSPEPRIYHHPPCDRDWSM